VISPLLVAVVVAGLVLMVGLSVWTATRRARAESDARWRVAMQKLGAYCERFAADHALVCVKGSDEWPYGWPRVHGSIDEASFSLAFGWRHGEDWVASMRMRGPSQIEGEFRVWRVPPPALPNRGRIVRLGDASFDLYCTVWMADAIDVAALLSPAARAALLSIPTVELAYRDGLVVISWPCESFLGEANESAFATIEAGYKVLAELSQSARSQRVYR
jgi:hypothetical protein